jgi:hypothetical protein
MASWFYLMMLMALMLPLWTSVGAIEVAIILMDILLAVFWGSIPSVVYPIVFLLNVFAFTKALLFRPFSPSVGGT